MKAEVLKTRFGQASSCIQAYGKQFISRRSLARLLSVFLCCLVVVIRPVSKLGGEFAFLVLALRELVLSVQENLAQQLELTVLNVTGALLGIGLSTLAKYIASLTPDNQARSRATCATFLVMISFFAGWIKSRMVRLQLSMRISLFVSTWLLTTNIGVRSRILSDSGAFLFVTFASAIISLVSLLFVMALLRWPSTSFEGDMARTFALLRQCLSINLQYMGVKTVVSDDSITPQEYSQFRDRLLQQSINLNETYSQAAFELRIGRLSLKSIRPFISIVEHLRREVAWGLPIQFTVGSAWDISNTSSQYKLLTDFEAPAVLLGHGILAAMQAVERLIVVAFQQGPYVKPSSQTWSEPENEAIHTAEEKLVLARDHAREKLARIFTEAGMQHRAAGSNMPKDVLNGSLVMITLLQMAQEMRLALKDARRIASRYEASAVRLWYPQITLAWLGVPQAFFMSDDFGSTMQLTGISDADEDLREQDAEERLTIAEARQALAEQSHPMDSMQSLTRRTYFGASVETKSGEPGPWYSLKSWSRRSKMLWSHPRMVDGRMWLSKGYRSIQHSSHIRHAMKSAIGVAILSFPAFMPGQSAGRRWFTTWHGQWMVISYLRVLETNTGATWRIGYLRLLGTITGAIYAYITWLICKRNPYGLVVLVTAADVPITWMITKTELTPLAVPASLTLPTIVLAQYIVPEQTMSVLELAGIRVSMIAAGIIAALLVNSLVFPRHCRVLFLSDTGRTLGSLSNLYMTLSHEVFHDQHIYTPDERRRTQKLELQIRNALHRLSGLIVTMGAELSLLPKPLRHYRQIVTVLQKLLDLMTGLRKMRTNIPREQTVASVFKERQEFMSSVCIILFACQHAFRTREPLPQFLPSTRQALSVLQSHVRKSLQRASEDDPHSMGLSLVYAFAEQDVMKNLVDTLEELLKLTGRLFGTSAWLTQDPGLTRTSMPDEGDRGWYSTFKWEET
ncbi:hypothetical protein SCP_0409290 [Sparassis crispa]|uniref:Uncharacterized protein n=1 Tax=Sparassis crispa TaxID=139825 RepID=A0A401GK53_9APHY|nr:hypothetical protein SCP_0409290 [Sparassis crispa]GBE82545.1 hypothetical protein SCP_0409290 [Sparassis crispa]